MPAPPNRTGLAGTAALAAVIVGLLIQNVYGGKAAGAYFLVALVVALVLVGWGRFRRERVWP